MLPSSVFAVAALALALFQTPALAEDAVGKAYQALATCSLRLQGPKDPYLKPTQLGFWNGPVGQTRDKPPLITTTTPGNGRSTVYVFVPNKIGGGSRVYRFFVPATTKEFEEHVLEIPGWVYGHTDFEISIDKKGLFSFNPEQRSNPEAVHHRESEAKRVSDTEALQNLQNAVEAQMGALEPVFKNLLQDGRKASTREIVELRLRQMETLCDAVAECKQDLGFTPELQALRDKMQAFKAKLRDGSEGCAFDSRGVSALLKNSAAGGAR